MTGKITMTQASNPLERRLHPRFPVRTYAQIHHADQRWEAHLLDMSMSGAKLAVLDEHSLVCGDSISLFVTVEPAVMATPSAPQTLQLKGKLIHLCEHLLGVDYEPATAADKDLLVQFLEKTC
jgi:hypothetical protein